MRMPRATSTEASTATISEDVKTPSCPVHQVIPRFQPTMADSGLNTMMLRMFA